MCDDNDNGFFQFLPARKSPDLLISALRKAALPCLRRRCLLVRFGDHQGTVSRITNYALWVCWDCTGPEVYPVHSGALDQYWSGFVPHHLFMTRRRGGDFCPPKTDLESGLLLSRSASDEICPKISQNFSPAGVTSPFVARAMPMAAARTSCRSAGERAGVCQPHLGPVYLRVSAACLPNFFKSRSNVSRSFFERTLATSSIAAACSPNPRLISARPLGVSSTLRTRRSSG